MGVSLGQYTPQELRGKDHHRIEDMNTSKSISVKLDKALDTRIGMKKALHVSLFVGYHEGKKE